MNADLQKLLTHLWVRKCDTSTWNCVVHNADEVDGASLSIKRKLPKINATIRGVFEPWCPGDPSSVVHIGPKFSTIFFP